MREFMTRLSDYFSERRNDPERQEGRLAVVLVGTIAVIVIVLLLILLMYHTIRGADKGRTNADAAQTGAESNGEESREGYEASETYMSEADAGLDDAVRQEYLASVEYLREKVATLLQTMTQVQEELDSTTALYREQDSGIQTQITGIRNEVDGLVKELKETQVGLLDLTDLVQTMNRETLTIIQAQLAAVESKIEQVNADIAKIYTKIAALETEDRKLWASLKSLETKLKDGLDNDLAQMTEKLKELSAQTDEKVRELSIQTDEKVRELSTQTDEKVRELSTQTDEKVKELSTQTGEKIQELSTQTTEKVKELSTQMSGSLQELSERLQSLASGVLMYQYDENTNTLYLLPYEE